MASWKALITTTKRTSDDCVARPRVKHGERGADQVQNGAPILSRNRQVHQVNLPGTSVISRAQLETGRGRETKRQIPSNSSRNNSAYRLASAILPSNISMQHPANNSPHVVG